MAKYTVRKRESQTTKPKRSFASIAVRAVPGFIGLGLIGLGFLVIVAIHSDGQNPNSRAGVGLIVVGIVVLGFWALSNKSDGYNF